MKALHKRGPWRVEPQEGGFKINAGCYIIGMVYDHNPHNKDMHLANARLIAKSPTMFEFIERVAKGQHGELKGQFIDNIRREAKELINSINTEKEVQP